MGYDQTRSLQWMDLCPHLGAPERTLLRVLTNLTTKTQPVLTIAPAELRIAPAILRRMIYSAPVSVGEEPKIISISGLLRQLRNVAALGQITTPEGEAITFSSSPHAQQRVVAIGVWLTPRHECGTSRNVEDALARAQGKPAQFDPA